MKKWLEERLKTEHARKQYGRFVSDRLRRGKDAIPLPVLVKLTTIKDRRFANEAASRMRCSRKSQTSERNWSNWAYQNRLRRQKRP